MKKILLIFTLLLPVIAEARELRSPSGRIAVNVELSDKITYSVAVDGTQCLAPSEIAMELEDGTCFGVASRFKGSRIVAIDETIVPKVYFKNEVRNRCNELTLRFNSFDLVFRAYDNGVAYRFVSKQKKQFNIVSEKAEFNFVKDFEALVPYVRKSSAAPSLKEQFHNSFENRYTKARISDWTVGRIAFLPLMVECDNGVKLVITESDLIHYPGMYLCNSDKNTTLEAVFAPYPKTREPEKNKRVISMYVTETENYIARSEGHTAFPWRVIGVSRQDSELLSNDLVYSLASPEDTDFDFSWVKPGKVSWDWWNDWNIQGVDFRSGINTETYKYYIDFAAAKGLEYVILDEGWSDVTKADLYTVVPQLDMEELISYAAAKNVGIILWAGFYPFQKDVEGISRYWAEKGIKGFKVDFFDSDDQQIPELLERMAKVGAENHLVLDFHGVFKPTGLCRKYPNVLNYEGIYGLETTKWAAGEAQAAYEVSVPFIRYFAGPADYTPGAMRNFTRKEIHSSNSEPGSVGTRCRQIAQYVVFYAPLNMLCDTPANYYREKECADFISAVPVVWDEIVPLESKVGEYVAMARRKGTDWYIAAMNDWKERDVTVCLDFIGDGEFSIELFRDGVNADRIATDYKRECGKVSSKDVLTVHLAPAGGFAARISALPR